MKTSWSGHEPGRGRFPRRPARALCPGRQLGRRAGGEARRPALSRLVARPRQARHRAEGGAGRPEGAADEGGPAHRHHPRRAAAGIRARAGAAAGQCAGHGLGLRAPAHGDRARPGLAGEVRQLRQGGVVRGLAGPGPSRDAARRHRGRGQAAVPGHGVGARSRSQPAEAGVRCRPTLRPGHPHRRDPCRDHHAPARGTRLSPRGQARRCSTATCCATSPTCTCPRSWPRIRPTGCSP